MKKAVLIILALLSINSLFAQQAVLTQNQSGAFPIVTTQSATPIYVDAADHWLVQKAAALLQTDIEKVTGKKPDTAHTRPATAKNIIIIGSLDQADLLKKLVKTKKLRVDYIKGKWEAFQIQVVPKPFPGIDNAL